MASQVSIKKGPLAVLIGTLAVGFGLFYAFNHGMLGPSTSGPAAVPEVAALPVDNAVVAPLSQVPMRALPTPTAATISSPEIRFQGMKWNSQLALLAAIGGERTTAGSLMAENKVNARFVVEDDVAKQQTQLVAFAKALRDNPQPTEGAHFMAVMGDGSAATIQGIWDELAELGPEYQPEVIGSAGYSRGEDKLMGPPEWKTNPRLMRGSLIAGYLRDGDWNIALKFGADNNIKNNPDERTYDPDAINWYSVDDFIKAGDAYIDGVCEDRPVVVDGRRTGEKKHICVNGVVTWTPGDVNVARKKGGLISIVSTKEYRSQMPNTIIGIKKWNTANRDLVERFLDAMYKAGDQVKSHPAWLTRGAEITAAVYGEEDAAYWEKYFKGVVEPDITGKNMVELGGSSVNNLQDVARLYGLVSGVPNIFAATYTVFGDLVKAQYPKLMPSYPAVTLVLNTSYTENLLKKSAADVGAAPMASADAPVFTAKTSVENVVSKRNWAISFETGQATFTPDTIPQLQEMRDGLLIADDLVIEIHGHTDSTGNPEFNKTLSRQRAEAVRQWLMKQGSSSFPVDRFAKTEGHGSEQPAATNDTVSGRAKNRRVVVVLGT